MSTLKSIAVFCGSSLGDNPAYAHAAESLGRLLAQRKIALIYGGGNVGLMGKLATAALAAGAHVTGVMPTFLMKKEVGHLDVHDLRIVNSMHERKALIESLADGFIALPGGFGTLEEFCEILTWSQLGLHAKPFGLLNTAGFYDHFLTFINHAAEQKFIRERHRALLLTAPEPESLLDQMRQWKPTATPKWVTPEQT